MSFSTQCTPEDVEAFVERLYGRGWVHAVVLMHELGINRRHLRALAEASKGRVISGNKGYHVTATASAEEVDTCHERITSQGRKMLNRGLAIRRVFADAFASPASPF